MRRSVLIRVCVIVGAGVGGSPAWLAAQITVTPSASTVARGSDLTFTVAVTPSTYVQKVTLTYGTGGPQDEDAQAPYAFTHAFSTPALGLTVTATVQYSNGEPDGQASTQVNVVAVTISGQMSANRGSLCSYTAEVSPSGLAVSQFDWTFLTNTYQDLDIDQNGQSTWAGKMVTGGSLGCTAIVSGLSVSDTKSIAITPRAWTTPITCGQDNEAGWGDVPDPDATLGEHRDRDSNIPGYYFVPRSTTTDFSPSCTLTQITGGPCAGLWWVSSSTLKCQRETVINKYIKADGAALGGENFVEANESRTCLSTNAASFLEAVKNHEYRGSSEGPPFLSGHHGRTEYAISLEGHDAKAAVEPLWDSTRQALLVQINTAVWNCEYVVAQHSQNEDAISFLGLNWGEANGYFGFGSTSRWDGSDWTGCINDPAPF